MNCQQCRINLEFALANPSVVKGITPYPTMNENIEEFKPTKARCLLAYLRAYLIVYLLAALIGIFVLNYSVSSWLLDVFFSSLGVLGLHVLVGLSKYQEQVTITISKGNLSGPSGWWRYKRCAFPLERLDTSRARERTPIERWLGYKYIWSTDGSRIHIEPVVFERDQVNAILNRIGLQQAEALPPHRGDAP